MKALPKSASAQLALAASLEAAARLCQSTLSGLGGVALREAQKRRCKARELLREYDLLDGESVRGAEVAALVLSLRPLRTWRVPGVVTIHTSVEVQARTAKEAKKIADEQGFTLRFSSFGAEVVE